MIVLDPDEKPVAGQGNKKQKTSCSCTTIFIALIGIYLIQVLVGFLSTRWLYRKNPFRPGRTRTVPQRRPLKHTAASRKRKDLVRCRTNMKNLGMAIEMYSIDNNGEYPQSLTNLTPKYLKNIPSCPAAGTGQIYVSSYQVSRKPRGFTIYCAGSHHKKSGIFKDFPRFTSRNRLQSGP